MKKAVKVIHRIEPSEPKPMLQAGLNLTTVDEGI
jgi:hypothetical protein